MVSGGSDTGGIFASEIFGSTGIFGNVVGTGKPVGASAAPAIPDSGTSGAGSCTPGTMPACAAPTLLGITGMVGLPVNRSDKHVKRNYSTHGQEGRRVSHFSYKSN